MRHRRNTRRKNVIIQTLTNRNFLIICSILIAIIILLIGGLKLRSYLELKPIIEQAKKLDKETQEIFSVMDKNLLSASTPSGSLSRVYNVDLSIVGDILCQTKMLNDAKQDAGTYDFTPMFSNIKQYIQNSDLAIGTLETNVTNDAYSDDELYNAPIELLQAVKNSGIGLVSLAHNHVLDYGIDGVKETLTATNEQGIETVGVRKNKLTPEEESSNTTSNFSGIIKEVEGIRIAFLAYTYGLNEESSFTDEEKSVVNIYSNELALNDLEYAKQNSNYIIAIMHWGDVNSSEVSDEQNEITGFLVENGVDMILGSHPSVVQPMQIVQDSTGKNVLVAYSLGNYIATLDNKNSDVEIILNVQIAMRSDEEKAVLQKVSYVPVYMLDNGANAENRFELTDMKALIREYTEGNTDRISRSKYRELVNMLEKLQRTVNGEE